MIFMLDTDTCSYLIGKRPFPVLQEMENKVREGHEIIISSITYAELRLGAKRAANSKSLLKMIALFCERLDDVCAWDKSAAEHFSDLQAFLLSEGTPIGINDTLIAAHGLSLGATLVSNNIRHFSKVPGLNLVNWTNR